MTNIFILYMDPILYGVFLCGYVSGVCFSVSIYTSYIRIVGLNCFCSIQRNDVSMEEILVFVIFCGMCMTLLCAYMMYYSYLSIRLRERSVTDTPSSITQL